MVQNNPKKLKEKVDLMERCYYKGFANSVLIILCKCENYLTEPDINLKANVLKKLAVMEPLYDKIPFKDLEADNDFVPLLVIRDLFEVYARLTRSFLNDPQEEKFRDLNQLRCCILDYGEVYRRNIDRTLDELRQYPEYSNYNFTITNHQWNQFKVI